MVSLYRDQQEIKSLGAESVAIKKNKAAFDSRLRTICCVCIGLQSQTARCLLVRTFEIYDSILLEVSQKCACGTYHITLKRYVSHKTESAWRIALSSEHDRATARENFVKFGHVIFEIREQTNDIQACWSQYFTPVEGEVILAQQVKATNR